MLRQATNVGFTATRPSRRSVALLVRAEAEGDAKPPPSPRPTPPRPGPRAGMREPAPPGTMRGPDGQLLKVVPIEKAGDEAWAGVAAMDDGQSEGTGLGKVAQLVAGDALVLLLFAVIGRINHGEVLSFETIATVLPFWIGWFVAAGLLEGYGKEAQNGTVPEAALTAVKGWALGIPLAVVFRSLAKGYIPDKSFIIVGLVVNFVFLVGWRSAYAALQKKEDATTPAGKMAQRKNKKGNPFEFFQLLKSLTTRW